MWRDWQDKFGICNNSNCFYLGGVVIYSRKLGKIFPKQEEQTKSVEVPARDREEAK